MARTVNLGILAHVDAGKTSLTERLLHLAGVIDEVGSVDDGSTQTDFLALERQRGITIKSAVVSFAVGGVTVNLLDTPGHPDFIAEVERVLSVLDGAVLVLSAVEGVQSQTRVLMRALQRLRIPTLLFVNKIDRGAADCDRVLRAVREKLTPAVLPMGSVRDQGTRRAGVTEYGAGDEAFTAELAELLAEHDDGLLAAYVAGSAVPYRRLRRALAAQTARALVHPVYFGSAITGAGVEPLVAGVTRLLPAARGDGGNAGTGGVGGNGDGGGGPVSGTVFKVERGPAGEKVAYVRMFSGTIHTRDRVELRGDEAKVTAISVFDGGSSVRRGSVTAGQIGRLWGLDGVRIGDTLGAPPPGAGARQHRFAPPTLEAVVAASRPADAGRLHAALTQLAEQDPLIDLRLDEARQELVVSLYGEVQKEVIGATLAGEYGVEVAFRETTTIHVERPAGTGAAFEIIDTPSNPFLATVGLRVEPAAIGSGVRFGLGVELGSMPYAFFRAVEETVRATLRQGLYGWQVTDCAVTMTHSGYWPRQSHAHQGFDKSMSSTAGDFRNLTPLVLMSALRRAGTTVYEPMHRFRLDVPAGSFAAVLPVLARLRAVPAATTPRGASWTVDGVVPAAMVHELQQQLPGLTSGEGVLECSFDGYQPVRGPAPARPRTDANPLDRKEYLLRVQRRV